MCQDLDKQKKPDPIPVLRLLSSKKTESQQVQAVMIRQVGAVRDHNRRLREGTEGRKQARLTGLRVLQAQTCEVRRSREGAGRKGKHRRKRPNREELRVSEVLTGQTNGTPDEQEANARSWRRRGEARSGEASEAT